MPSTSKSQQQAAGIALSAKRGETPVSKLWGAAKEMYNGMSEKELEDFAGTKTKNLPNKVEEMNEGTQIDKYDIGVFSLGNGLTVVDRKVDEHGDYKKLAHISNSGKVTWYDKKITPKAKKYIMNIHKKTKQEARNIGKGMKQSMKLKEAMNFEINEDVFSSITDPDSGLTTEQKTAFLEAVAGFNKYSQSIYREQNLKDITEDVVKIGKLADKYIMAEQEDWFDGISVKRDMKSLQESIKMFEVTAKEVSVLQQRLESVYEEVGGKLGKYFDIKDIVQEDELQLTNVNEANEWKTDWKVGKDIRGYGTIKKVIPNKDGSIDVWFGQLTKNKFAVEKGNWVEI